MGQLLKYISKPGLPAVILLLVGAGLLWLPSFADHAFGTVLLTMLLTLLAAAIMQTFFHRSGLTRETDMLPLLLYVVSVSVFPALHTQWQSQVAVCALLIILTVLFRGFREKDTSEQAFLSTLLLLLASMLVPDMIWLFPFIWIAYIILSAFGFRTMLATLIALAVFAIYLGIGLFFEKIDNPFLGLLDRQFIFESGDPEEWIMQAVLMFMGCYFFIISVIRVDRDSVRQQAVLTLFALFFAATIAMVIYPMLPLKTLPLMLAMLTGLAVTFFRQNESVHRGIVFLLYLLLLAAGYLVPTLILNI
ncbi:MAG: hypothetical protein IK073_00740 [Paludibacteraceae bacterium]|nr:hypothetical protein [Paludibacteraceae bacterium]